MIFEVAASHAISMKKVHFSSGIERGDNGELFVGFSQ
jgi:hypothetical protein